MLLVVTDFQMFMFGELCRWGEGSWLKEDRKRVSEIECLRSKTGKGKRSPEREPSDPILDLLINQFAIEVKINLCCNARP